MQKRIISAILLFVAAGFGALTWHRWRLPYNEEGRYFDATEAVVYHEQGVMVWMILALLCGIAGLSMLFWRKKT